MYFFDDNFIISNLSDSPLLENNIEGYLEILIHLFVQIIIGT